MSKENKNPYRDGVYHDLFAVWQKKQVITRQELVDHAMKILGKGEAAATAAVTVLLSPRKESKRGDCRGNLSAQGHLYFAHKCQREVKAGVKGVQKFRLSWRTVALEGRVRIEKIEVAPAKTEVKVEAKVEAKVVAKTEAKPIVKA